MKEEVKLSLRGGNDRDTLYLDDILFGRRLLALPAFGGFQPPGVQCRLFFLRHELIFRQSRKPQEMTKALKKVSHNRKACKKLKQA